MFSSFSLYTNITSHLYGLHILFLLLISNARSCHAAETTTDNIYHGNVVDLIPNRLPQYSYDSLPQVIIRLHTKLPVRLVKTSISLHPTKLSSSTVSKGVAFLPYEWGVWGAEVLDGPFMAKREEKEADQVLRRSAPEELGTKEEGKQKLGKRTLDYEIEEREELDDDYKQGETLVCHAAGFQKMKYELDFMLRESWGAAIWEVECWVPRKGILKRWWESLWSE